jgi:ABC-type amino acid transport substrate-binding protein
MLDVGRIDGFIGYEFNWDYVLNEWGWANKFSKLPVFDSTGEYLVVMKTNPRGKNILRVFDQGLRKLKRNGKFTEIRKAWLGR